MDFTGEIIHWYHQHKRDLPWRKSKDPYIIWLSEIILQQTRVEQGMPYFYRFSERYPTVADFAAASEGEILKLWQGLGYYSRGRNMHHTANIVMEEHEGYFPKSYEKLIKLKGIGEYTAAAIASFSAGEAKAVVDGNVFRLLSRYFAVAEPINTGKGKKLFTELANQVIDPSQPGTFNQAVMEFGSLQCKPKNPRCVTCPLQPGCGAYRLGKVDELPVKIKSQSARHRYFNYLVIKKNGLILVNKRGPNDIWQGLYEFPLFETEEQVEPAELVGSPGFKSVFGDISITAVHGPVKHVLSHQKLIARFIEIREFNESFMQEKAWAFVDPDELEQLPQPKLIFEFLKKFSKLNPY